MPQRVVVAGWGYLIWTGNISTIWPLFGTGNQLLATIALAITTTFLINMGKAKYALLTFHSNGFVGVTTISAGVLSYRESSGRCGCSRVNILWDGWTRC